MKKARNVKVGSIVEVPFKEFAPYRSGWNGWLFRQGIVREIVNSQKYGRCYKVEFPSYYNHTNCKRTITKVFIADHVFATDLKHSEYQMEHPRSYWCNGCYDDNTEFMIDNGILEDIWKED